MTAESHSFVRVVPSIVPYIEPSARVNPLPLPEPIAFALTSAALAPANVVWNNVNPSPGS